jgi:hypothetical protein
MRYDTEDGKKALLKMRADAQRTLSAIRSSLLPELSQGLPYRQIVQKALARMEALPPEKRREMTIKIALALSDLDSLQKSMAAQRDDIAAELRRIRGQGEAIAAYNHTHRATTRPKRH